MGALPFLLEPILDEAMVDQMEYQLGFERNLGVLSFRVIEF